MIQWFYRILGWIALGTPIIVLYLAYSHIVITLFNLSNDGPGVINLALKGSLPSLLGMITFMAFLTNVSASLARIDFSSGLHYVFKHTSLYFFVSTIALIGTLATLYAIGNPESNDAVMKYASIAHLGRLLSMICTFTSVIAFSTAIFIFVRNLVPIGTEQLVKRATW